LEKGNKDGEKRLVEQHEQRFRKTMVTPPDSFLCNRKGPKVGKEGGGRPIQKKHRFFPLYGKNGKEKEGGMTAQTPWLN